METLEKIIDWMVLVVWLLYVIQSIYLHLKGEEITNYRLMVIIILSFAMYNNY